MLEQIRCLETAARVSVLGFEWFNVELLKEKRHSFAYLLRRQFSCMSVTALENGVNVHMKI